MAGEESLDKGYFVQPTAFSAEDHMTIVREDIFGPVVACMLYKTIDE
ncbi:aldehyde dehydrogenase family protein [Siminovitchia sediminis]|uniref:Aldehyde dehydrogenase family protein n=1 Tax=Siminovitchia sediminis TaxID=1274353 RepID=A0ABW4KKA3_9BACI